MFLFDRAWKKLFASSLVHQTAPAVKQLGLGEPTFLQWGKTCQENCAVFYSP